MTNKMKIEKARQRCYKKAFVNEINYEYIVDTLYSIQSDCEEIKCYGNLKFEELADALGDDDMAYEFDMMFNTLSSDCYSMLTDLQDSCISEYFDDFFVAVKGGDYGGGKRVTNVYFKDGKFAVDGSNYKFKDLKSNSLEVIGNIHDNPELLKGEANV